MKHAVTNCNWHTAELVIKGNDIMATLQTSGNIHKEYTVSFGYKGQDVEISVNDNGSSLELRVDNKLTHEIYGYAYDWQSTYGLHGAAKTQATIGQLRKQAIYLIENPMDND
ncbi:MAG TPA: hypothetical protein VIM16_05850 [Mucilaginibacter sp.]